MPRSKLENLDGQAFDVAVIGAGLNGASAAQHLAAAGYTVLLVDKGDYASGSSSRSTRILSGGIRYPAPGDSMWEFARHPSQLATALSMAKQAMTTRSQFVNTTPERARKLTFCFPIYKTDAFKPWQVRLAFKLLEMLGPGDIPLDFEMVPGTTATKLPLVKWLRNPEDLTAAALFREYQFQWPERVGIDAVLDAERMGAVVRNYTPVTGMAREGDGRWALDPVGCLGRGR
ncbi:MAG: FAD-dependent oxidoreductase [Proteobacteria bacterium]|nr:FAD-dependent oxidoreductase [Pseudomonadota bacterium]